MSLEPKRQRANLLRFFQSRDPLRNGLESSPRQGLAGSVLNNPTLPPPQQDVVSLKRRLQPLRGVSHTVMPLPLPSRLRHAKLM